MFLNNRYHDPTIGTFLSVDPLVGRTGQAYLYANGSPVTLTDPSGLQAICPRMGKDDMTVWYGMCAPSTKQAARDNNVRQAIQKTLPKGGSLGGALKFVASAGAGVVAGMACTAATGGSGVVGCAMVAGAAARATSTALNGGGARDIVTAAADPKALALDWAFAGLLSKLTPARSAASSLDDVATNTAAGFGGLSRADDFGVWSYRTLKSDLPGTGLQAHHLIEKRFAGVMGQSADDMASIAVTPAEHQVFTNAWREAIPYGANGTGAATRAQIEAAARDIYSGYPDILKALGL